MLSVQAFTSCQSSHFPHSNSPSIPFVTGWCHADVAVGVRGHHGCWRKRWRRRCHQVGLLAFGDFHGLASCTLPKSVASIGRSAFSHCSWLSSLVLPNSLTCVGSHAFDGCRSLTALTLPDSVETIGEQAFWSCVQLTSLSLPHSLTSVGNFAFQNCIALLYAPSSSGHPCPGWHSSLGSWAAAAIATTGNSPIWIKYVIRCVLSRH